MNAIPSLRDCLVGGGDERLDLHPVAGVNRYGHGPEPRADELAMGSSTASTISVAAFAEAARYHGALAEAVAREGAAATYAAETDRIRAETLALLGTAAEIVLAPSGTDLHLYAAHLLGPKLQTITPDASETGSGVGNAAAGRHFMARLPSGAAAVPGEALDPRADIAHHTLRIRTPRGGLRDEAELEEEIGRCVAMAGLQGRSCLLVMTDVSKTGLIAPSLETVFRLKDRHGDRLDILVDACQLRIAPATIRAYLDRGFLVAITGSKFVGAPIFSGALLCPPAWSARLRDRRLPAALGHYGGAADWPKGWRARRDMPERANFGLLVRWHAALFEWRAFLAQPAATVARTVALCAAAIEARLRDDPAFSPIPSRPLDRSAFLASESYDGVPTIFPFHLARRGNPRAGLLTKAEAQIVHLKLAERSWAGESVRLGQPIACGMGSDGPLAALRLCLCAAAIAGACASEAARDELIAAAMRALDAAAQAAAMLAFPRSNAA